MRANIHFDSNKVHCKSSEAPFSCFFVFHRTWNTFVLAQFAAAVDVYVVAVARARACLLTRSFASAVNLTHEKLVEPSKA